MKAKLIVSCLVSLILLVVGCATIGQFGQTNHKNITLCSWNDAADCLSVTVPEEYPDFFNEFRDTAMCMADMIIATCIWHDGETAEDGSIPTAKWYTMMFWSTTRIAETSPIILEFQETLEHKEMASAYYLYDEKGVPKEVSEYECQKYLYNIYGYPLPPEEEYYKQKKEAQEEWDKALKEYEEQQRMEELGQQKT